MSVATLPTVQPSEHPDDTNVRNRGLVQAYKLRDFAAAAAMALQTDMLDHEGKLMIRRDEYGKPVDLAAIAQLIKGWSEARDAIRIIRGRPLPGSLKPEPKSKPRTRPRIFEPTPVADTEQVRSEYMRDMHKPEQGQK